MMKITLATLTAVLLCLQGCETSIPPVQGTVTDLVTGLPIADVDVVVLYFGESSEFKKLITGDPFHHYIPGCGANRITKTDAKGQWRVDGFKLGLEALNLRYSILLYKDGYREGIPGRYETKTVTNIRLTANKDVYEWNEIYQTKRDYSGIIKAWGSKEAYQKAILTPYEYLAGDILGSDSDHQYVFIGCREKGTDDPALNAFAERFILKWLDDTSQKYIEEEDHKGDANACERVKRYVIDHPNFMTKLHATPARSRNLRVMCHRTMVGVGNYDKALGIQ